MLFFSVAVIGYAVVFFVSFFFFFKLYNRCGVVGPTLEQEILALLAI